MRESVNSWGARGKLMVTGARGEITGRRKAKRRLLPEDWRTKTSLLKPNVRTTTCCEGGQEKGLRKETKNSSLRHVGVFIGAKEREAKGQALERDPHR